jgi:DNA repair protein RadC
MPEAANISADVSPLAPARVPEFASIAMSSTPALSSTPAISGTPGAERAACGPPQPLKIKDWPLSERPREKLLARGSSALSDAELLAILLGSGRKGRTAVDMARILLNDFGSLSELLAAGYARWRQKRLGLGPATCAVLMAAMELTRRHYQAPLRFSSALSTPDATRRFLVAQLRDRPYEVFCALFLDNRHRLIAFEEIFRGTIDSTNIYPREIVRQTLYYNAASLIIAHNHPSGSVAPSPADEHATRRIREALAVIDVRLLDHFIVGESQSYSFSEHGLL